LAEVLHGADQHLHVQIEDQRFNGMLLITDYARRCTKTDGYQNTAQVTSRAYRTPGFFAA